MAYDGSVRIKTDIDDREAQKRLNDLDKSIELLEKSIFKKSTDRDVISERLRMAREEAERTKDALQDLSNYQETVDAKNKAAANVKRLNKELQSARLISADVSSIEAALAKAKLRLEEVTVAEKEMREYLKMPEGEDITDAARRISEEMNAANRTVAELTAKEKSLTQEIQAQESVIANQRQEIDEINAQLFAESTARTEELEARVLEALEQIKAAAFDVSNEVVTYSEVATGEAVDAAEEIAESVSETTEEEKEDIRGVGEEVKKTSEEAGEEGEKMADRIGTALNKTLKSVVRYGLGMRSLFVLYRRLRSALIDGLKEFANVDAQTQTNLNNLKASLNGLKGSFVSAFAPIINAVIPILVTLINWLTAAANAVSMFFAILTGKSTYKKAVANLNEVGKATQEAGDAAAEAAKNFSGLDELNIWSENKGGGGGGSASAGSAGDLAWEDTPVDVASFVGRLAISFKDIYLDWKDLTGEQIAEKILAGLIDVLATVAGFTLTGSIAGGVAGAITGIALSVVADQLIFDHDGVLDTDEILEMISDAATALAGGAVVFWATGGNIQAALVGAAVTLALDVLVSAIFKENGVMNQDSVLKKIGGALGTFLGGMVTFYVSGKKLIPTFLGGIVGLALGVGVAAELDEMGTGNDIQEILTNLKTLWNQKVEENGGGFIGVGKTILGFIISGFSEIASFVDSNIITPFLKAIGGDEAVKKWEKVKEVGKTIWENFKSGFTKLTEWVDTNIVQVIKNAIETGEWSGVWDNIKSSIKSGIPNLGAWAVDNIINPIGEALMGKGHWAAIYNESGRIIGSQWVEGWQKIDSSKVAAAIENVLNFDAAGWVQEHIVTKVMDILGEDFWTDIFDKMFTGLENALKDSLVLKVGAAFLSGKLTTDIGKAIASGSGSIGATVLGFEAAALTALILGVKQALSDTENEIRLNDEAGLVYSSYEEAAQAAYDTNKAWYDKGRWGSGYEALVAWQDPQTGNWYAMPSSMVGEGFITVGQWMENGGDQLNRNFNSGFNNGAKPVEGVFVPTGPALETAPATGDNTPDWLASLYNLYESIFGGGDNQGNGSGRKAQIKKTEGLVEIPPSNGDLGGATSVEDWLVNKGEPVAVPGQIVVPEDEVYVKTGSDMHGGGGQNVMQRLAMWHANMQTVAVVNEVDDQTLPKDKQSKGWKGIFEYIGKNWNLSNWKENAFASGFKAIFTNLTKNWNTSNWKENANATGFRAIFTTLTKNWNTSNWKQNANATGWLATFTSLTQSFTTKALNSRWLSGWLAYFTDTNKDKLTTSQKIINTIAKFTSTNPNGLSNTQKTINSIARFISGYWWDSSNYYLPEVNARAVIVDVRQDKGVNVGGSILAYGMASGGILSGGRWRDLPQYASGTTNAHGTLFLAGEAGPEVVGHVGGKTEILNLSQIAAAISAGVAQAISNIKMQVVGLPAYPAMAGGTVIPPGIVQMEESLGGIKNSVDALLDRLNSLSLGARGGDINVSAQVRERTLFDVTIEQGRLYKAQTGRNPFDL